MSPRYFVDDATKQLFCDVVRMALDEPYTIPGDLNYRGDPSHRVLNEETKTIAVATARFAAEELPFPPGAHPKQELTARQWRDHIVNSARAFVRSYRAVDYLNEEMPEWLKNFWLQMDPERAATPA